MEFAHFSHFFLNFKIDQEHKKHHISDLNNATVIPKISIDPEYVCLKGQSIVNIITLSALASKLLEVGFPFSIDTEEV